MGVSWDRVGGGARRFHELVRLKKVISDLDVFYRLSESEDGSFELIKAWKTVMLVF